MLDKFWISKLALPSLGSRPWLCSIYSRERGLQERYRPRNVDIEAVVEEAEVVITIPLKKKLLSLMVLARHPHLASV
jgi:hypothetical protein